MYTTVVSSHLMHCFISVDVRVSVSCHSPQRKYTRTYWSNLSMDFNWTKVFDRTRIERLESIRPNRLAPDGRKLSDQFYYYIWLDARCWAKIICSLLKTGLKKVSVLSNLVTLSTNMGQIPTTLTDWSDKEDTIGSIMKGASEGIDLNTTAGCSGCRTLSVPCQEVFSCPLIYQFLIRKLSVLAFINSLSRKHYVWDVSAMQIFITTISPRGVVGKGGDSAGPFPLTSIKTLVAGC